MHFLSYFLSVSFTHFICLCYCVNNSVVCFALPVYPQEYCSLTFFSSCLMLIRQSLFWRSFVCRFVCNLWSILFYFFFVHAIFKDKVRCFEFAVTTKRNWLDANRVKYENYVEWMCARSKSARLKYTKRKLFNWRHRSQFCAGPHRNNETRIRKDRKKQIHSIFATHKRNCDGNNEKKKA